VNLSPEDVRLHIPLTKKYIYLDNAATTPTPKPVLDSMMEYYTDYCANIERAAYSIASQATVKYDEARKKSAELLLKADASEFIFTRNLTQAANMVAYSLEHPLINRGPCGGLVENAPLIRWIKEDNIVFSNLEHHSNILPWMRLAKRLGIETKVVSFDRKTGRIPVEDLERTVDKHTKLLAIQHVSNVMGTVHPVKEFTKVAKEKSPECLVFVDGSQGPGHMTVDVKAIGADFYGFSGHKGPFGPKGTGGLYVRRDLMEIMEPEEIGGGTIGGKNSVTTFDYELRGDEFEKRWDAGTPNIAGLIGLGRGAVYVAEEIGLENIEKREKQLTHQLLEGLARLENVEVYGPTDSEGRSGTVTFNVKGMPSHDVALYLSRGFKILTRAGHHCAIPAMCHLGIWDSYGGNVRVSFHYFNMPDEVDAVVQALKTITT
jgi:cysteine desulfurase / selenocysteine lyase